jgi:hypothetical protein
MRELARATVSFLVSSAADPSALVALAVATAVGRIFLALLPPGLPGRHGWSALPITLATSYLLGSIAIDVEANLLALIGIEARPWMLALPWAAVALGRWTTLPGAIVPRHEPASERAGLGARTLHGLALIFVAGVAWKLRGTLFPVLGDDGVSVLHSGVRTIADVLALVCVCAHGLESARRAPLGRALAIAIFAALVALEGFGDARPLELRCALCFGAGAAFAVPWLRRADRRAGLVSVIAFAAAALPSMLGAILGLIGLIWLCLCTARPSRRFVITAGTVAFVSCFGLHGRSLPGAGADRLEMGSRGDLRLHAGWFGALAVLFALTWMRATWMRWKVRREALVDLGHGVETVLERPLFGRDAEFLSELGFSALIALLVFGEATHAFAAVDATLFFAPVLLLSIGTELVRADAHAERA